MPRKNTSVVSFSLDLETLIYLDDYATNHGGLTRSQVIRYHLRMGKTYLQLLDAQKVAIDGVAETLKEEAKHANGVKNGELKQESV